LVAAGLALGRDQARFVMRVLSNRVQNTAMRNLRLIDGSGLYAVHTIRACFYLRMQTVNSYAVIQKHMLRIPQNSFESLLLFRARAMTARHMQSRLFFSRSVKQRHHGAAV
jgi:hypothetical protein